MVAFHLARIVLRLPQRHVLVGLGPGRGEVALAGRQPTLPEGDVGPGRALELLGADPLGILHPQLVALGHRLGGDVEHTMVHGDRRRVVEHADLRAEDLVLGDARSVDGLVEALQLLDRRGRIARIDADVGLEVAPGDLLGVLGRRHRLVEVAARFVVVAEE